MGQRERAFYFIVHRTVTSVAGMAFVKSREPESVKFTGAGLSPI